MKTLIYQVKAKAVHPFAWLIVCTLGLGLFRASTIPNYHNYDEYHWHRDILSTKLDDCLYKQDCETIVRYFLPSLARVVPVRGGPYFLAQASIQLLFPQVLRDSYSLLTTRSFTVFIHVLFLLATFATLHELFPKQRELALLATGFAALIPSFSDIMSGVNLDAPAALTGALIAYTSARVIRRGVTFSLLCAVVAEAIIGYALKGTVWPLFLLFIFSFVVWLPVQHRKALILLVGSMASTSLILLVIFSAWLGAANWFYPLPRPVSALLLPNQNKQASVTGEYSLETTSYSYGIFRDVGFVTSPPTAKTSSSESIIQILPEQTVNRLRGRKVTFGVWARAAEHEATVYQPYCQIDRVDVLKRDVQLDSQWQFLSAVYDIPLNAAYVSCALGVPSKDGVAWYDGMILAEGEFANDGLVTYFNSNALSGTWGGKPFVNLLRNPSAEQAWLQVDPFLGFPFPVNQRIVSFLSWELTGPAWINLARWSLVSFWATFGGEQPGLSPRQMIPLAILTVVALSGIVWTMIYDLPRERGIFSQPVSRYGFWMLIVAVAAIAALIIYRADIVPFREVIFDFSSMRHASAGWSAMCALLALGILRWIPLRHQRFAVSSLIIALFLINMHIFLRVQLPLYTCSYNAPIPGGQSCLWILPLD
jgi:hypothetical protein